MATNKTLLPPPYQTLLDIDGDAVAGGTVTFLETGSAVLAVVYADANGLVISANPLTVDAAGRYTVFLTPGQVVDVEYRDAFGALIKTVPGVMAVPGASGNVDVVGIVGDGPFGVGALYYLGVPTARWHLATANGSVYQQTLGVAVAPTGSPGSTAVFRTAGRIEGYTGLVAGAFYYLSNTGGALSLTPGLVGRLVGQADSTTSLVLWPNPPGIDPPMIGTVSDSGGGVLTSCAVTHPTMALGNTAPLAIHGIKAGYHGQRVRFIQYDRAQVNFVHNSASALGNERLLNCATSAPTSIAGNGQTGLNALHGSVDYVYDVGYGVWRMTAHEQGGWITDPFNAADYTANGGMTWTVVGGGVKRGAYYLRGNTLQILLRLNGTIGGTLSTSLSRKVPGGFTAVPVVEGAGSFAAFTGTTAVGAGAINLNSTRLDFYRDLTGTVGWEAGPVYFTANISIEVA